MPGGRPSDYDPKFVQQAYRLSLLGLTDAEMAGVFGIAESTLHLWKLEHPEFSESIEDGKSSADAKVAESLYKRSLGYSHEAVKIFMPQGASEPVYAPYIEHYPPDTQAASLWLCNQQSRKWRDKQEIEHTTSDEMLALLDAGRKRAANVRGS